jgi:hypothetical protein
MYSKDNSPELILREHYNNLVNINLMNCYFVSLTILDLLIKNNPDIQLLDHLHEEFYDLKYTFNLIVSDHEKRGTIDMLAKDFNNGPVNYHRYYDSVKKNIEYIDKLLDIKRELIRKT